MDQNIPAVIEPETSGSLLYGEVVSQASLMMEKAVSLGNVDVVERVIAMRDRDIDRKREIEFKQAYAAMWPNLPQIERQAQVKNKSGGNLYKYAEYEHIHRAILPTLKDHFFALSFQPVRQDKEGVTVEGELIWQKNGWSKKAELWQPIVLGSLSLQQAQGMAQSYCIRYLTIALLALVMCGEDNDGRVPVDDQHQGNQRGAPTDPQDRQAAIEEADRAAERAKLVPPNASAFALAEFAKWDAASSLFDFLKAALRSFGEVSAPEDVGPMEDYGVAYLKAREPEMRRRLPKQIEAVQSYAREARKRLSGLAPPAQPEEPKLGEFKAVLIGGNGMPAGGEITDREGFASLWATMYVATTDPNDLKRLRHLNGEALADAHRLSSAAAIIDNAVRGAHGQAPKV